MNVKTINSSEYVRKDEVNSSFYRDLNLEKSIRDLGNVLTKIDLGMSLDEWNVRDLKELSESLKDLNKLIS